MCEIKRCRNCQYAEPDDLCDFTCNNEESEYCGDWIEADDCCEAWCYKDES